MGGDNDPRVTRVGKFLRSSRLDEIPQLWCVLKGDMAFVGPRPERPEFIEMLSKEIPYYGVRHMVRPGVTGWAQIKYKYGSTSKMRAKNCSTTCSTSRTLPSVWIC
jgi:lipopolysaccharide/colanic/teichoic acid biosynthesis glycosyltransferase